MPKDTIENTNITVEKIPILVFIRKSTIGNRAAARIAEYSSAYPHSLVLKVLHMILSDCIPTYITYAIKNEMLELTKTTVKNGLNPSPYNLAPRSVISTIVSSFLNLFLALMIKYLPNTFTSNTYVEPNAAP